jgi:hypothetical protein
MINERVDWEESQNILTSRPYREALYQKKMIWELDITLIK